jgi:tRNA(Ile)-lysidine synthase
MLAKTLIENLKQFSSTNTIWIAYSGGVDSHVLLHCLAQNQNQFPNQKIKAIHIHHGLSTNADNWQQHCLQVCHELSIELISARINVVIAPGESLEDVARKARYQHFATLLQQDDLLLTAHHQDDQAETVLLQLIRGAGVDGLSAMPTVKSFDQGFHVRPLLNFTRNQLLDYAYQHQLNWIEDESNNFINYDRNYLRHEVMPALMKRWPKVSKTLSRAAKNAANSAEIQLVLAEIDYEKVLGNFSDTLSIIELLNLSQARRNNVIRYWLNNLDLSTPSFQHLALLERELLLSAEDAKPKFCFGNAIIRRYRNNLFAEKNNPEVDTKNIIMTWDLENLAQNNLVLPQNLGILSAMQKQGVGLDINKIKQVIVRFRQNGESLRLVKRQGTHKLKKLMQEWHIPPWLRNKIPLLYCDNNLVAIPGFGIAEEFATTKDQLGWQINWKNSNFTSPACGRGRRTKCGG